jgi:hypothetical protein
MKILDSQLEITFRPKNQKFERHLRPLLLFF